MNTEVRRKISPINNINNNNNNNNIDTFFETLTVSNLEENVIRHTKLQIK